MAVMHVWCSGLMEHPGEIAGKIFVKTSFSPLFVFLLSRISGFLWCGVVLWHLWIGRARHPGPGSVPFLIQVLNVGGWLTHCDFALDVGVDFLAVVEHRLIPARVRSEWARLRCKKIASIWAHLLLLDFSVFC